MITMIKYDNDSNDKMMMEYNLWLIYHIHIALNG